MPSRMELPDEAPGLLISPKGKEPLFLAKWLIDAAKEYGLDIKGDAEQVALQSSDALITRLHLVCEKSTPTSTRAERLPKIKIAIRDLMQQIDLSPNSSPSTARLPASVRDLLRPGLRNPPHIGLSSWLLRLAGGAEYLKKELAEHQANVYALTTPFLGLAEQDPITCQLDEAEDKYFIDGKLTEILIDILPQALLALLHTAEAAYKEIGKVPEEEKAHTKPPHYAVLVVMKVMAKAHTTLFGFAPKLQTTDHGRETASVLWVKQVLQELRKQALSDDGKRLEKLTGSRAAVDKLKAVACYTPETISKLLAKVREDKT